jgi:hypothetical protein
MNIKIKIFYYLEFKFFIIGMAFGSAQNIAAAAVVVLSVKIQSKFVTEGKAAGQK